MSSASLFQGQCWFETLLDRALESAAVADLTAAGELLESLRADAGDAAIEGELAAFRAARDLAIAENWR